MSVEFAAELRLLAEDAIGPVVTGPSAVSTGGLPDAKMVRVVGVNGAVHAAGDVDHVVSTRSIAKPFVSALARKPGSAGT